MSNKLVSEYGSKLTSTLNAVSSKLTLKAMLAMNTAVSVDQKPAKQIADAFLKANGLKYRRVMVPGALRGGSRGAHQTYERRGRSGWSWGRRGAAPRMRCQPSWARMAPAGCSVVCTLT